MQKQARQWPVLFSDDPDLSNDIARRTAQLYEQSAAGWLDPFILKTNVAAELAAEYGIDACRLAILTAGSGKVTPNLLESSFKWLNNLYNSLQEPSNFFSAQPWLEAALQIHDQILQRRNYHGGLALMRKACKIARPGINISPTAKALVLSTIYPFAPLLSVFLHKAGQIPMQIPYLQTQFAELISIRFALANGGWHWKVFDRASYELDPIEQFRTLKWVRLATAGRPITLQKSHEGVIICHR